MNYHGYSFGVMPGSKLNKTIMSQPNTHSTTFEFGRIVPIQVRHINPGDIIKSDVAGLIRMSTPIAPIMTGIHASLHAFFVPERLVWDNFKQFMGEADTEEGPETTEFLKPSVYLNASTSNQVKTQSLAQYLGYPLRKPGTGLTTDYLEAVDITPIRAYYEIINYYYRIEQVEAPILISKNGNGVGSSVATLPIWANEGSALAAYNFANKPVRSLKNFDIYTTCLIAPSVGETILPLGSYAPIVSMFDINPGLDSDDVYHDITKASFTNKALLQAGQSIAGNASVIPTLGLDNPNSGTGQDLITAFNGVDQDGTFEINMTNLVADLSKAVGANVRDLYTALAVEKWHYHANYGTRYFERLEVSYGTTNPDLVLQRPEHLGEYHFDINIQTVLSQSDGTGATLGKPGANSATGFKCNLFNHSFGEHGWLFILLSTYSDHVYSGGIQNEYLRKSVLDYYWPEFVNLADEGVKLSTLYYGNTSGNITKDKLFGFQESWAFERFKVSRVSGLLDPYTDATASSGNSDLAYMPGFILGDKFDTAPSLNSEFLRENRTAISQALVSGTDGPDFVADFAFIDKVTRSITPKSRPGIPTDLR